MIAIVVLVTAGVLYLVATYWREEAVPQRGAARPDRVTSLLTFYAVCAGIAAVLLSNLNMITVVVD